MANQKALFDRIYAPWGGNGSELAGDIDELPVTVNQWRYRGNIPTRYWPKIREKAATRGVDLPLELFVELATAPTPKADAA